VLAQESSTHKKTSLGRRAEYLLQPIALQGTPKVCAAAWGRAGAAVGGRRCSALAGGVFPSGCGPSSSSTSPPWVLPCSLCCIPRGQLMCEPDLLLEERRWGLAEQPCNPLLHGEHRPVRLLFFCLLLEGSANQGRLRSWKQ